jgi:DUF1365 family protein
MTGQRQHVSKTRILIVGWATCTLFWSIFTEPSKTFAARIILFQPFWLLRAVFTSKTTWTNDLLLVLILHALFTFWTGAWTPVADLKRIDVSSATLHLYLQFSGLLAACGILAGLIVQRGQELSDREGRPDNRSHGQNRIDESLLPPLLIPSRTNHARLHPKNHSFSYSYLFVGIPVGLQGRVGGGNVLSIDSPRPAWFDVRSEDFLSRSQAQQTLAEKLKRYLHAQGVTDRDYAFAYLVTAPRFLRYSFNPVSFWYLYDSDTRLKYMVLEVNNTFDERRMYLLKSERAKSTDGTEHDAAPKELIFSDTWNKDFHVSPFNSRKGSYSLKAIDPLAAYQETGQVKIDNTIVLRSSKDEAKIVARVFSEGPPREPTAVTALELTRFIAAWWWVGLATFPRIVWEAQKLFFKRKLHVWYRPETAASSIGRNYNANERALEEFFRVFLTHVVEHSNQPLRVIYEPAHNENKEFVLYSPGFTYEEAQTHTLTLKVLSPAFYSRFIHYGHAKEAFDRECLATDEKNRTLLIDGAHALPILLDSIQASDKHTRVHLKPLSVLDRLRWSCVQRLRCPPAANSYPSTTVRSHDDRMLLDIRSFPLSEMDRYIQHHSSSSSEAYTRIATKLFAAERLTFGFPALLKLFDLLIRASLVLAAMNFAESAEAYDVLRPRSWSKRQWGRGMLAMGLANGIHLWDFLKG